MNKFALFVLWVGERVTKFGNWLAVKLPRHTSHKDAFAELARQSSKYFDDYEFPGEGKQ